MLKRKEAASQPEDFSEGSFRPIVGDSSVDPDKVTKVLLCSGRITWDLVVERRKREGDEPTTAIVRLEQLYPRPVEELKKELARYSSLEEVHWVQDVPANMGPWPHVAMHVAPELPVEVTVISRPPSTSPAVGQASRHKEEQQELLDRAMG
jgi:2-oxoglutarate dehydrogenase E1 component